MITVPSLRYPFTRLAFTRPSDVVRRTYTLHNFWKASLKSSNSSKPHFSGQELWIWSNTINTSFFHQSTNFKRKLMYFFGWPIIPPPRFMNGKARFVSI